MKNKVYDPATAIPLTVPYAVSSGNGVLVGALFGVAEADALINTVVVVDTQGSFRLPKATGSGTGNAIGTRVFWDNSAKSCTAASATGLFPIGTAIEVSANTDTTVHVKLTNAPVVAV